MFENKWVDNEVRSLKSELNCSQRNDPMFYKLLVMLIVLLFVTVNAFGESIVLSRYFPDTWTCPNRSCGYQNYEGIDYCALCGTRRR